MSQSVRRKLSRKSMFVIITGVNNVGTEEDAGVTGIDGSLVSDAIDYSFAAVGRVEEDTVLA